MGFEILFSGFPGVSDRGFLGWSSCALLRGERTGLFDTAGFGERGELVSRLAGRGIAPGDVDFVILSHFHFDHAANLSLFPRATVYLHEAEARHAGTAEDDIALVPELYRELRASGRMRLLSGESGEVEGCPWLLTPGHTPGGISLLLERAGADWALAGDAVKNLQEARTGEVWMSRDPVRSRESIAAILSRADFVVPGHDRILRVLRGGGRTGVEPVGATRVAVSLPEGYPGGIACGDAGGSGEAAYGSAGDRPVAARGFAEGRAVLEVGARGGPDAREGEGP